MRLGKLIAKALLMAAFLAAMLEVAGRVITGTMDYMSAHDLLYTFVPGKYIVFQSWIEDHISRALWDPVLRTVLSLPAWALFGIPGVALAWACRTRHADEEEHGDAGTTYEDIVAAAKEADEEAGEYLPSKYAEHAEYDPTKVEPENDEDVEALIRDAESHGGEPPRIDRRLLLPHVSEEQERKD